MPLLRARQAGGTTPVPLRSRTWRRHTSAAAAAVQQLGRGPATTAAGPAARLAAEAGPAEHTQLLRERLSGAFANGLLLDGDVLPCLCTSKHFVNLTNGLELVPVLQGLQQPLSFVRIRSTSLEQQAFESLMLELDASFLLALALGHSVIVWDTGCRHQRSGAPRALWYGTEFIRYALQRTWCGAGGSAHVRGHNVARDFEQTCRNFQPSTKTRLRYYKRFVSPAVQQQGVRLAGLYRRTDHDEDVEFFTGLAHSLCGPATLGSGAFGSSSSSSSSSSSQAVPEQHAGPQERLPACPAAGCCRCVAMYEQLVEQGVHMFTRGLGHSEFSQLAATPHE